MDATDMRISKLSDFSKICLSTLETAGLSLALLKPLLEDRQLRAKHIQADAFIAHQQLATILFGSFLTEVFSISEGVGRQQRQQASLFTIRDALETQQDVVQRLEASWGDSGITKWDDPEGLLGEINLKHLRQRDAERRRAEFSQLRRSMIEDHNDLIQSE